VGRKSHWAISSLFDAEDEWFGLNFSAELHQVNPASKSVAFRSATDATTNGWK